MSVETADKMLAEAATRYPPDETEGPLEISEDDPQAEVGVVVRLPGSTLELDRLPVTPTADVAEETAPVLPPVPSGSAVEERS
eukprot:8714000-Lingulodinium_polyedra.AAC.1